MLQKKVIWVLRGYIQFGVELSFILQTEQRHVPLEAKMTIFFQWKDNLYGIKGLDLKSNF